MGARALSLRFSVGWVVAMALGFSASAYSGELKCLPEAVGKAADAGPRRLDALQTLEKAWGGRSFFDGLGSMTPEDLAMKRAEVLAALREPLDPARRTRQRSVLSLDFVQAHELHRQSMSRAFEHPICLGKSPFRSEAGRCLAPAVGVHLSAVKRGVDPESIRKIWFVSQGDGGEKAWVATMVRAKVNGGWLVIDPHEGLPVVPEAWLSHRAAAVKSDRHLFFVSDARRFGPHHVGFYRRSDFLGDPGSNSYDGDFKKLMEAYRKEPAAPFQEIQEKRKAPAPGGQVPRSR